jgi:5'-phosphate synthase pdxT subunit
MNFVKVKTIGVLALQGAYNKHSGAVRSLGFNSVEVRTTKDMNIIDGLIIPGGESTTIGKILAKNNLIAPIKKRIDQGMAVFGTCAGMILLAKSVPGRDQPLLEAMDITVERNAYGRQIDSFEAELTVKGLEGGAVNGIFIRAPKIVRVSDKVEVLAAYENVPVLVRQSNILAASFHPELSDDLRIHSFFISTMV